MPPFTYIYWLFAKRIAFLSPYSFQTQIFVYTAYCMEPLILNESIRPTPPSLHFILRLRLISFTQNFFSSFCNPKTFTTQTIKKQYRQQPRVKGLPTASTITQKLYNLQKPLELANNSSYSRFSAGLRAGNSRNTCRRLKLLWRP